MKSKIKTILSKNNIWNYIKGAKKEGLSALDLHKDKIQKELRSELQKRQTSDLNYLIDVVGLCNLRCPSCAVGNSTPTSPKGTMSVERYEEILTKIEKEHKNQKVCLHLYNWGEPSLHKDLGKIIQISKAKGFEVGISSNLNKFPDMMNVIAAKPSWIRVSLSGYSNPVYQKTHRNGDINLVKANLHMLRYYIDKIKSDTIIQVGFHVYKSNFPDDFLKMKNMCDELEFIFEPTLASFAPLEKAIDIVDGHSTAEDKEVLENLVISIEDRVKILKMKRSSHTDCWFRKSFITINWDSSVSLCCATYDKDKIIADNFMETSFGQLQAKKYAHPFCNECMSRSLDLMYTGAGGDEVEKVASHVLGKEYRKFRETWNSVMERKS